ncbi:MAG: hypothetical protein ACE5Q6_07680 [Dehalococcoidia bacterium]
MKQTTNQRQNFPGPDFFDHLSQRNGLVPKSFTIPLQIVSTASHLLQVPALS